MVIAWQQWSCQNQGKQLNTETSRSQEKTVDKASVQRLRHKPNQEYEEIRLDKLAMLGEKKADSVPPLNSLMEYGLQITKVPGNRLQRIGK